MSEPEGVKAPDPVPEAFVAVARIENKRSEEFGIVAKALAAAQGCMMNGLKSKEAYNYSYMDLGQLLDIVRPHLTANGLCLIQTHELFVRRNGPSIITHTILAHESNQWFETSLEVPVENAKGLSKAQCEGIAATYGRRYAIQALCMVTSEADTDGSVTATDGPTLQNNVIVIKS